MDLNLLRIDCARAQKKGIHFIIASVILWSLISLVHYTDMDILSKNFFTFCLTAPLMPLAYLVSRFIHVDFQHKSNPLTKLGIIFSVNQMLYLIIAMWIYPTLPDKMLMVIAIIFGAHLLPYAWLYQSKSYAFFAVLIAIGAWLVGVNRTSFELALMMTGIEVFFVLALVYENKRLKKQSYSSVNVEN